MVRMIDLVRNKEQKVEKKEPSAQEMDTRIFPRPEEQKGKTEVKEREKLIPDKSIFASKQEEAVLSEKELTEISTLNEVSKLYDIGINILDKISTMETIDHISWQEIQDFIGKVVEITIKDSRVTIDVATNHFTDSSYLHETIMNTCLLAIHTGIGLGYSKDKLIELGTAAFLHDIGMFDIKDIVNEEDGLTKEQFKILHQHPNYSLRKLENLPEGRTQGAASKDIKAGISQAHERIDGSGYPEGIKGNDIHEYAQIIGVVNVYEAMTHPRAYKKKKLPYDAMKIIINLAGKKFNSKIARTFVNQVSLYPVGSLVKLNNGEVAKVIEANKNFPLCPVVAVLLDKDGNRLETPRVVDLRKNLVLSIKESIDLDEVGIGNEELLNVKVPKG